MPGWVPNAITIARIVAAPVVLVLLLVDAGSDGALRWWAAALFVVAIATDGLDGALARRYDAISDLGKLLDPIADKALTGIAFVGLSILGELPWWITVVVLVREIGVTVYRLVVVADQVLAAAWLGKVKTVAQAVALSLALLPLSAVAGVSAGWAGALWWLSVVTMTVAVVLTLVSGADFVVTAVRTARRRRVA